jgi:hypothetical protein
MQITNLGFSVFAHYLTLTLAFLVGWMLFVMVIAGVWLSGVKQINPFEDLPQGTP